jgi:GABA(A) receptor-associated protein
MSKTLSNSQTENNNTLFKTNASKILRKYPDKIPVIFNKAPNAPNIDKNKYIIPRDLQVSQLMFIIRKKIDISPEKAIFIFFGKNNLAQSNMLLSEVYEKYKDKDDILYATYSVENTFGSFVPFNQITFNKNTSSY